MTSELIELPLVFVGGLLGSSHCLGMCGGFALALGAAAPSWRANLARQLIYSAGRILTYATAGAMVGYLGWRASGATSPSAMLQAALAIAAGVLLAYFGLASAGVIGRAVRGSGAPCASAGLLRPLLTSGRWSQAFAAGVLTGWLPCGLVYAMLALAAASGHMLGGGLRMAAFGLGTVPLMISVGAGGSLLSLAARQRALAVAGWCVTLAGGISCGRGVWALCAIASGNPDACPFCH